MTASPNASLFTYPRFLALNTEGYPLAGGKLYSYQAGTLTPQATYTDATLTVPNPNPIILDAFGTAAVWLGSSSYKFNLLDANGVQQADFPIDNVTGYAQASAAGAATAVLADLASTAAGQGADLIPSLPFKVLLGADPTGATDSTAALTAVIASLGAQGGVVCLPKQASGADAVFSFSQINLTSAKNVVLMGSGGKTGGSKPAVTIQITGNNTKGIILDASSGCRIEGLAIFGTNATATGALISATNLAHDFSIENCTLAVPTVGYSLGCLLDLDYAYTCNFTNVNFSGGTYNVRGQHTTGTPANSIAFRGCQFVNYGTAAILDSGTAWTFDTCSFEPNWTTLVFAVYRYTNGVPGHAVTFRDCWIGDVQGAGTHIQWSGSALTIEGCWIDIHTCTLLEVMENNCYGIAIKRNKLITFSNAATILDFGVTTGHGYIDVDTICDNSTSLTRVAGTLPAGIIVRDQSAWGIGSASPQATGFGFYVGTGMGVATALIIGSTSSASGLNMIGSGNVFFNITPGGRSAPTYQIIAGTSALTFLRYTSTGTLINTPLSIGSAAGSPIVFDAPFATTNKLFTANGATTTFTFPAATMYQYITTSAASLAVTLPATSAAIDGQVLIFVAGSAVATATWVAGTGGATIVGAPASLSANVPVRMIYHHATTQWLPF